MPDSNDHFRMMGAERFGHVSRDRFNILVPGYTLFNEDSIAILLFPRPMDNLEVNLISYIRIKIAAVDFSIVFEKPIVALQQEINIDKIVESPALFNQRMTNNVS